MAEVKGVLVPNITFFKADGSLDPERNRWHMNWLLDNGVNGLFVTGSYGSGPLMSNEERIEQFKIAKEAVAKHPGLANLLQLLILSRLISGSPYTKPVSPTRNSLVMSMIFTSEGKLYSAKSLPVSP